MIGVGVLELQREVLCIRERSGLFGTRADAKQNLSSVVVLVLVVVVVLVVVDVVDGEDFF